MSATICWEPVPTTKRMLMVDAPQSFLEVLRCATDAEFPLIFDETHVLLLKGCSAGWQQPHQDDPFRQMIDLIQRHGAIRIWAEY